MDKFFEEENSKRVEQISKDSSLYKNDTKKTDGELSREEERKGLDEGQIARHRRMQSEMIEQPGTMMVEITNSSARANERARIDLDDQDEHAVHHSDVKPKAMPQSHTSMATNSKKISALRHQSPVMSNRSKYLPTFFNRSDMAQTNRSYPSFITRQLYCRPAHKGEPK